MVGGDSTDPGLQIGYVGQHLASLITGVRGTGTGARGDDLEDGTEVKSCNKIDQVDKCRRCGERVLRYETVCSRCGCTDIDRKDDSKWLFSVRSEAELDEYCGLDRLLLLLFDYPGFTTGDYSDMRISAYEVYPNRPEGRVFRDLVTNHYRNIYLPKTRQNSKANPMNLHPFHIQFYKCHPVETFSCTVVDIDSEASIRVDTYVTPDAPRPRPMSMPSQLLYRDEWDVLTMPDVWRLPQNPMKEVYTAVEFERMPLDEKRRAMPMIDADLLDAIPLRDIKPVIQRKRYVRR